MSYPPQPPYGHSPTPDPQPWPPGQIPPRPKARWPWLVLAVAVLFLASAGWFAYNRVIKKDSGIAACEAMASGKTFDGSQAGGNEKLTEERYRAARKVFEDSRYDDIKNHGTKLMDVVWQVSQLGDKPGLEALAYLGTLTTESAGLQSACADQGIVVNLNLSPSASGSPAAERPRCNSLFRDGKSIDQDKAVAGCLDANGDLGAIAHFPCSNGPDLFSATDVPGVKDGWGWGGDAYNAMGNSADDPAYGKALQHCLG